MRRIRLIALLVLVVLGSAGVWYVHPFSRDALTAAAYKTSAEKDDVYTRFLMESYDTVHEHYWKTLSESDLGQLFYLSLQKAGASVPASAPQTRTDTAAMIAQAIAATSSDARHDLALATLQVAIYNLPPAGRDEVLSSQGVSDLRNRVNNVDPASDLYTELGVATSADSAAVRVAYETKAAALADATSSEAKQTLAQLAHARNVLTDANARSIYDETHAEPTLFSKMFGDTLYVNLTKFSATTPQELANAVIAASSSRPTSLVLDMRGNLGGSLDFAPFLLGLFTGQDQYAFDIYHQDEKQVQRTTAPKVGEFGQFKNVVVLTDNMTQSTAEVLAASFKRFHLATVVGTTTRGWGTVENTFPLTTRIDPNTQYALLLVFGLTLRDDGQPIEGAGVVPDIATKDVSWRRTLERTFPSGSLASMIERILAAPPLSW